jgi:predicted kinase
MWNHLPVRNLIDMQRRAALEQMGEQARLLLAEGYAVDADRVLDEMNERKRAWMEERAA